MARRRGANHAAWLAAIIIGLPALLAVIPKKVWMLIDLMILFSGIPKEVWILIGSLGAAGLAYYLYAQSKTAPRDIEDSPMRRATRSTPQVFATEPGHRPQVPTSRRFLLGDEPANVAPDTVSSFRVPPVPKGFGIATWIPHNQSLDVAGVTIPGGMIYIGTSLRTPLGDNDPCLIDPSKSISSRGDYTERLMDYWPSYSRISSAARRAYLNWLIGGRRDPEADIGFVFLFFYGLERRAIIDARDAPAARADWPVIAREIRRLLDNVVTRCGKMEIP